MDEAQRIDLIEKLLKGELPQEEEEALSKQIQENSTMEQDLRTYSAIFQGIADAERESLFAHMDQLEQQAKNTNQRFFFTNTSRILAIAASLLLLITLYVIFLRPNVSSAEALYASYYQNYPDYVSNSLRGESSTQLEKAFRLYTQGEYQKAIPAFEALAKAQPKPEIHLYWALSYLEVNDTQKAIEKLKNDVLRQAPHPYENTARWYLALGLVRQRDIESAKQLLNLLVREKTDYATKASKLLDALP